MTASMSVKLLSSLSERVCSSQGLFCLYDFENPSDSGTKTVVLWNPAIRKSVDIVVPNVLFNNRYKTVVGFGVSPHTNDPMLVKITNRSRTNFDTISCIPGHVEVFSISSGVWRSLCENLPCKSIEFSWYHVVADRFIYWKGIDMIPLANASGVRRCNLIMSFDMESEEFAEICLSDYLAHMYYYNLDISKLRESLVVLETDKHAEKQEHVVWIMEHGVQNSLESYSLLRQQTHQFEGFLDLGRVVNPLLTCLLVW